MITITKDRPIFYAVGNPVIATGLVEVGGLVVTELETVVSESETEFLAETVGKAGNYKPLPDSGWLEAGTIYGYNGGLVIIRQSHNRTEHDPASVPALFCVYREDAAAVLAWVAGEKVEKGTRRAYGGKTYECVQAHVTQFTPDKTPALWKVYTPPDEYLPWVQPTGAHDAYPKGAKVLFKGHLWESKIDANVYSPAAYPAGWLDLGVYP